MEKGHVSLPVWREPSGHVLSFRRLAGDPNEVGGSSQNPYYRTPGAE
jgi:hypothetical protein